MLYVTLGGQGQMECTLGPSSVSKGSISLSPLRCGGLSAVKTKISAIFGIAPRHPDHVWSWRHRRGLHGSFLTPPWDRSQLAPGLAASPAK